ncbi:MAG: hypothetical protein KGL95_12500 [Patescibacteria group bacterium]|nr:hypothetical protein [Patescibacteria group bacterium]
MQNKNDPLLVRKGLGQVIPPAYIEDLPSEEFEIAKVVLRALENSK